MSEPLRLSASDEEVWRRTLDALNTDPKIAARCRHVPIRCAQCQGHLGDAWSTPLGPLFTSSWEVERPVGIEVVSNGKRLSRRATIRWEASRLALVSGPPVTYTEADGTIALLALPIEMAQDYPALMVRCQDHGDAVIDRNAVIRALRDRLPVMKVEMSFPRLSYQSSTPADTSHPAVIEEHTTATRRYGAPT